MEKSGVSNKKIFTNECQSPKLYFQHNLVCSYNKKNITAQNIVLVPTYFHMFLLRKFSLTFYFQNRCWNCSYPNLCCLCYCKKIVPLLNYHGLFQYKLLLNQVEGISQASLELGKVSQEARCWWRISIYAEDSVNSNSLNFLQTYFGFSEILKDWLNLHLDN